MTWDVGPTPKRPEGFTVLVCQFGLFGFGKRRRRPYEFYYHCEVRHGAEFWAGVLKHEAPVLIHGWIEQARISKPDGTTKWLSKVQVTDISLLYGPDGKRLIAGPKKPEPQEQEDLDEEDDS